MDIELVEEHSKFLSHEVTKEYATTKVCCKIKRRVCIIIRRLIALVNSSNNNNELEPFLTMEADNGSLRGA
jgi:hypothetical protein